VNEYFDYWYTQFMATIFKMLISPEFTPVFCWVRVAHPVRFFFGLFALSYYVSSRSEFRVVMSFTISVKKTMFGSFLPPVVCRRAHVLFTLFVFVCVLCCPTHIVLWFYFVFLPVSLDCPFLVVPSVFSNVYSNYHKIVFLK
jgi:hypothetical protein